MMFFLFACRCGSMLALFSGYLQSTACHVNIAACIKGHHYSAQGFSTHAFAAAFVHNLADIVEKAHH